jgi:hypothetical protein
MAETDLEQMLTGMAPRLDERDWVYAMLPPDGANLAAIMWFEETEGTTVVLEEKTAIEAGLTASPPFSLITLTVHSDLVAVGFIAKVTAVLAEAGIGTNVVAAFNHDHIFVPKKKAKEAMEVLNALILETVTLPG